MDIQTIEEEDETKIDTSPSSTTRMTHRSKYTQTTAFKPKNKIGKNKLSLTQHQVSFVK